MPFTFPAATNFFTLENLGVVWTRGALILSQFVFFPLKAVFNADTTPQLSAAIRDSFSLPKT